MKKLFALLALCAILTSCGGDDPTITPGGDLVIEESTKALSFDGGEDSKFVKFKAQQGWTAVMSDGGSWCNFSPSQGKAGDGSIIVEVKENTTGDSRKSTLVIRCGTVREEVVITQVSQDVITAAKTLYMVDYAGGELSIAFKANSDVTCTIQESSREWIEATAQNGNGNPGVYEDRTAKFNIKPFTGEGRREGAITISKDKISVKIDVVQGAYYESTDYSADGKYTLLSEATEGNGINMILMGDAFSDRMIADGTYEATMRKAMNSFFSLEPYTTFKNLFNVYMVNAVSKNEEYFKGNKTVFSTYFGQEGTTIVGGNDTKCQDYAKKIPGIQNSLDQTLVIVMMNKHFYAGTCYMHRPYSTKGDYGVGFAAAYFPLGDGSDAMFDFILTHEAGGHGFPKLGDEYGYSGAISNSDITKNKDDYNSFGWYKNLDYTKDTSKILWSKFISNTDYAVEALGAYEGAAGFRSGAYRPTSTSLMKENGAVLFFNAPSREAIYYRIHRLAYGTTWKYDHDEFLKYDAKNLKSIKAGVMRTVIPYDIPALHPPIIVDAK